MGLYSPAIDDGKALPAMPFDGWMRARHDRLARLKSARIKASMAATRSDDLDTRLSSLMASAQNGDREAYSELLRACIPLIKSVAGRRVAPDRVDDVVQDVLLTLHRVRHTYDPARPFTAWLRAIADHRAIDQLRRVARNDAREIHSPLQYESHIDPHASADATTDRQDTSASIQSAISTLSPLQREAVENLILNERSLKETAHLTGRSEGAIKVNLHRALKALRVRFQREPT